MASPTRARKESWPDASLVYTTLSAAATCTTVLRPALFSPRGVSHSLPSTLVTATVAAAAAVVAAVAAVAALAAVAAVAAAAAAAAAAAVFLGACVPSCGKRGNVYSTYLF